MKDEQIKQEELKAIALEDEALEGVFGGALLGPGGISDSGGTEYEPECKSESGGSIDIFS